MKNILQIVVVCILLLISYFAGWYRSMDATIEYTFNRTMDTVNAILDEQLKSDTSVTKLILVHPDTNTYYLSRKTVINK